MYNLEQCSWWLWPCLSVTGGKHNYPMITYSAVLQRFPWTHCTWAQKHAQITLRDLKHVRCTPRAHGWGRGLLRFVIRIKKRSLYGARAAPCVMDCHQIAGEKRCDDNGMTGDATLLVWIQRKHRSSCLISAPQNVYICAKRSRNPREQKRGAVCENLWVIVNWLFAHLHVWSTN